MCVPRLLGCNHRYGALVQCALDGELYCAVYQREQSVIFAHADVHTGVELSAALTNNDGTSRNSLATVGFYTQSFRFLVATVTR